MRQIAIVIIKIYQYCISPLMGNHCRYYPSCSSYSVTALSRFGLCAGGWLALKRLSRCHPWHPGGVDLVPEAQENQHGK